jgi:primary-amine oxidase
LPHNTWSRSIENLTVVVDMHTREVLRVVDEGVVPVPPEPAGFDVAALGAPGATSGAGPGQKGELQVSQAGGPGFTLTGEEVKWQNWSFHLRSDQRVGVVISLASWHDGNEIRPVMYQGFLSEIFVPYMDPAFAWFSKNYLDLGEYSGGGLTKPLIRGVDCPDYASYQSALVTGDDGRPLNRPDMICVYEREAGDMAWRHAAPDSDRGPEGRKRRDLVVRSAAVLGNYDYVFDWVFQQDGSITVAVGATGIVAVKAVAQRDAAETATARGATSNSEPADAYGRFVDQNMVAVNHDHYFNFRLDLDIDGRENNFIVDRLETKALPAEHPRRSVWVSRQQLAQREADAQLSMGHDSPELWMVSSSERKNQVGYATSFQLMPGHNAGSLLTADDYPQRRAGFIEHPLWVTPYEAAERFAAGDYPTLSTPGQGLPAWTAENRNIGKTDIVLWYTIGMHHLVRAEDWPVMPVMWSSFQLRPFNFFNHNPAMDLPGSASGVD